MKWFSGAINEIGPSGVGQYTAAWPNRSFEHNRLFLIRKY